MDGNGERSRAGGTGGHDVKTPSILVRAHHGRGSQSGQGKMGVQGEPEEERLLPLTPGREVSFLP